MKATDSTGALQPIPNFFISIPGSNSRVIQIYSLPEFSEGKGAKYNDEPILGRSFPLKTYAYSDNRSFNVTLHLYVVAPGDIEARIQDIRAIESAVYPRNSNNGGTPFIPPPVCQLQFGRLFGDSPVCAVLIDYSYKPASDAAWVSDGTSYFPIKMDLDTKWEIIYQSDQLPGQDQIFQSGV